MIQKQLTAADQIAALLELIEAIVTNDKVPWHEKRDQISHACEQRDDSTFGEFISWFEPDDSC